MSIINANSFLKKVEQDFQPDNLRLSISPKNIISGIHPTGLSWTGIHYREYQTIINKDLNLFDIDFSKTAASPIWYNAKIISGRFQNDVGGSVFGGLIPWTNFQIPFFSTEITVDQMANNSNGDQTFVGVKSVSGNNTIIGTIYDNVTKTNKIYFRVSGADNLLSSVSLNLSGQYGLRFVLADKSASAWVQTNKGWHCINRLKTDNYIDFRKPEILSQFHPHFYTYNPAGSGQAIIVSSFKGHYAGGVGLANQSQITYEDGTPIQKDNCVFFLANSPHISDPGGNYTISSSCAAIYSLNIETYELKEIRKINILRNGKLYGDNSGCIRFDRTSNQWILLIPNWSDIPTTTAVYIYKFTTQEDLLSKGITILTDGVKLSPPSLKSFQYDPDIYWDGLKWWMTYDETNFAGSDYRPSLATTTDWTNWTLQGRNTNYTVEGMKLRKFNDNLYVLGGGASGIAIFDLNMSYIGSWTNDPNLSSPPSHPNVYYILKNNKTYFYQMKFDGQYETDPLIPANGLNYSEGNVRVLKANESEIGYEFPIIKSIYP